MRIAVTGATGYIGGRLVPRLLAEGHDVVCPVRNPAKLEGRSWSGSVEAIAADVLQPETLADALRGTEIAYYLIHSMGSADSFRDADRIAATNFANAAEEAGVGRIVYLGGLVPKEVRSAHLKSRQETGDILRKGTVPVTEIRAGMIIGPGSAAWEVIRDLVNHLPDRMHPRQPAAPEIHLEREPLAGRILLEQIVAEEIKIPVDEIQVIAADTETTPVDIGSWISGNAYVTGQDIAWDTMLKGGSVFVGERLNDWKVIDGIQRYSFPNPLNALAERVAAVRHNAVDMPCEGIVLFGPNAAVSGTPPPGVCLPDDLVERFPKPGERERRQLSEAYAPHWSRLRSLCRRP